LRLRREDGRRVAPRQPLLLAEPIDDFSDVAAERDHSRRLALCMDSRAEREKRHQQ
jgi:hypothetical protein